MMERPQVGTHPAVNQRDSETYLDFVEGVYGFVQKLTPVIRERSGQAVDSYVSQSGHEIRDVYDAHAALGPVPIVATRHRLRRSIQEMKYNELIDDLALRENELLAELDRYDTMGPGSVSYDLNFPIPPYAAREIHLMPGGYVKHPLAGFWYHGGTRTFFMGKNDNDEIHQSGVDKLPLPEDGNVRRILDIGCSSGQAATALKKRFPDAEVWGLDIGMPMVRYAHKRAVDMGLEVHFRQGLAEATGFPDNSFDIVHAFILYHELPLDIGEQVAKEAHRLLRPGGLFLVTDFQTKTVKRGDTGDGGVVGEVFGHIDHTDNEEPYAWDFTHSDFEGMLGRIFARVEARTKGYGMPLRVATKAG